MVVIPIKHIKRYVDNRGTERWYFRRRGFPEVALPGEPLSEEFMAAYHTALSGAPKPRKQISRYGEGSVAWALTRWYASSKFKSLEPATRHNYRQLMERELAEHLAKPIKRLQARHLQEWMDEMTDRPGAAKSFLKRLKTFIRFCASPKVGILASNIAELVEAPEYETQGFIPWDEADAALYEARWPMGTVQRLAFEILASTGQRISDAAKMGRQDEVGDFIRVNQAKLRKQKKRVRIEIRIHPRMREAIQRCNIAGQMIYLQTQYGRPYAVKGLSQDFSRWARDAGIDPGKTAHGVRKLAGSRLAEAGCTEKQIMAVLGLSSIKEAALYTAAANQKRMASDAADKVEAAERDARIKAARQARPRSVKRGSMAPKPARHNGK